MIMFVKVSIEKSSIAWQQYKNSIISWQDEAVQGQKPHPPTYQFFAMCMYSDPLRVALLYRNISNESWRQLSGEIRGLPAL